MTDERPQEEDEERSGAYMDYEPSDDPLVKKTARKVRTIGYVTAVFCIVWLNLPIIIDVVGGAVSGDVRDPYTKRVVDSDQRQDDCRKWAFELIAAGPGKEDSGELKTWRERCADRHEELAKELE